MSLILNWNRLLRASLAAIVLSGIGCASLDVRSPIHLAQPFSSKEATEAAKRPNAKKEEKIEYGIPETMAVIWTDSVYTAPGQTPTRGFGGRFFFYDMNGQTIRVEGELAVFGFDDTDDRQQRKIPEKKFVYPAEQLQSHHAISDLGPSYSFWIPWDAVGGDRKTISLLPVLKTNDGKIVRGEQTLNVLPGRVPEEVQAQEALMEMHRRMMLSENRQISYTQEQPASLMNSRRSSTTIDVPSDLGRELRESPQAQREALRRSVQPQSQSPMSMPMPAQSMGAPNASMANMPAPATAMPAMNSMNTAGLAAPLGPNGMALPTERIEGNARVGMGPAPGFRSTRAAASQMTPGTNYPSFR